MHVPKAVLVTLEGQGINKSMFKDRNSENAKVMTNLPEQQMFEYRQNSLQLSSNISIKRSSRPNLQERVRHVNPA